MKYASSILAGLCILVLGSSFISLSGCERGYYRGNGGEYDRGYDRGYRHYYRDGRWYQRDSAGHESVVAGLAIGAVIDTLPPSHETVVIENTPYYHDDRYYYKQHPKGGYVVVPEPVRGKAQSQNKNDKREDRGGNSRDEENRGESR